MRHRTCRRAALHARQHRAQQGQCPACRHGRQTDSGEITWRESGLVNKWAGTQAGGRTGGWAAGRICGWANVRAGEYACGRTCGRENDGRATERVSRQAGEQEKERVGEQASRKTSGWVSRRAGRRASGKASGEAGASMGTGDTSGCTCACPTLRGEGGGKVYWLSSHNVVIRMPACNVHSCSSIGLE